MSTTHDELPEVTAANDIEGPGQGSWTYQDYAAIPDDGRRYEVVNGVLYMSPSPGRWHQETVGEVFAHLRAYVKSHKLGQVYLAPFDVELAPNIIVQPDVMLILHTNSGIITDSHIVGTPDLIVEVASPGTASYDRRDKQAIYALSCLPEYWLVDPLAHTVELLLLQSGHYRSLGIFHGQSTLPSPTLPNFAPHVSQFFD